MRSCIKNGVNRCNVWWMLGELLLICQRISFISFPNNRHIVIIEVMFYFSLSDKRVAQLQFQIDKLKEENFTLETGEWKLVYLIIDRKQV